MANTNKLGLTAVAFSVQLLLAAPFAEAAPWPGFTRGMGIGGWLTNYKRFNVLPEDKRLMITIGDLEHFDTYITEADVKRIKGWGFDHIRVGFDQIVLEERPFKYRERTFARLDAFVGWCAKYRINLVLNLHKAVGNYCDIPEKVQLLDDKGLQDRVTALWLEIERRYHDRPGLAFELLNEVRNVDPEKWNGFADRMIREIRAKNPTRPIVVGSTCWNSAGTLPRLRVWDDPNVIYTFHMYEPFEFTHQRGVLQSGPLLYNRELEYPSAAMLRYMGFYELYGNSNSYDRVQSIDACYLAGRMAAAAAFVKAHPDKVLWLGEFGTIRHAPKRSRVAYMRDVIAFAKANGIPWSVWNYLSTPNDGNRFSLVDDDTREFLSPELLAACLGENIPKPRLALADCPDARHGVARPSPVWATGRATGILGDALVIDVSDGAKAATWPVETLEGVDLGTFNCDVCKTDRIVLRKVSGGRAYAARPDSRGELTAQDRLNVKRDYWIGLFPVTAAQYDRVTGAARPTDDMAPRIHVSYNEIRSGRKTPDIASSDPVAAESFMGRLSAKCRTADGRPVGGFDLPTEVQWEIAARAGSTGLYGAFVKGDEVVDATSANDSEYAWCWTSDYASGGANGKKGVQKVGLKLPNVWGLYDTAGNVYEWCRDNLGATAWDGAEAPYAEKSPYRVLRSGFYNLGIGDSRPSYRDMANAYWASDGVGFRLARE